MNSTAFTIDYQRIRMKKYTSKQLQKLLCDFIKKEGIKKVYDFGAGTGEYIRSINQYGVEVEGFDATIGIQELNSLVIEQDITDKDFTKGKEKGMVICFEVLEHIDKCDEDIVIKNIMEVVDKWLIVSWARIGQGGNGHINEQNWDYVINKFKALGFTYMRDMSLEWREKAGQDLWWFKNTIFIFKCGSKF
jgi:hypothetical protein